MNTATLEAMERTEKPKQLRRTGYIPAVLNSDGQGIPVKFQAAALNKVIAKHGSGVKLWISLNAEKKFGVIKALQRHPVDGQIIHAKIQLVQTDQEIKAKLPIHFSGTEALEEQKLQLLICKAEAEASGEALLMPESVSVDVSQKQAGDNIMAADLSLPKAITLLESEDEVYAVIKEVREAAVAEETEVTEDTAEPEQATEA